MSTVPRLFESVVARSGDAPAVVFEHTTVGYAELNARANRLARRLIARGVGPDVLVAVAVPRSVELVTAVLAVLKAGGAYLPLDPAYPEERLGHMVRDARPLLVLRTGDVRLPPHEVAELVLGEADSAGPGPGADDVGDAERLAPLRPEHLMYVIYTSGSSGTPKGVAVPHAGVADMVATQAATVGAGPGDRVLQWASISFDAAFWDLTLGLLSGATLVLARAEDLLPGDPLKATLLRHAVTHAVLPPVALSVTDSDEVLVGGTVMSTGDACTEALVRQWSRGRRMFNGYGPTEVTVGATVAGPVTGDGEVGIGTPWIGNRVHVLDERLRRVPDGEEGELYLAGSGLARGYLGRPGATAGRFVPDPYGPPGSLMYRSGDRGLRRADGELFFRGRADGQVKVRGFRIELGEIEACLTTHPAVDLAAVVVAGGLGDARIVAYVSLTGGDDGATVDPGELRRYVAGTLPEHMVPSSVVPLDRLPTNVNGKIDRAALAGARPVSPPVSPAPEAPPAANGVEGTLCALVAEILDVPAARPSDNFFDLGGHSVLAAHLARRIRKEFDITVPMRTILEAETLGELADRVGASAGTGADGERAGSAGAPVP
ncbi:non-ribosomal peptide synthetase [Streptomyces sp. LP05-1]|uniref:Non-ribosomal peptide synthetase n=1 Tax=Streptomyces pyxinae TaxID=2970734 RepID=A0ABT2CP25_9ACTN|nr:non-ribosomal peptide synthetase [Streptomyces sp. LP05-1]MCS0639060.1 non-ribosomal peptide synthetase [Streptomyces sp. LP05-1]